MYHGVTWCHTYAWKWLKLIPTSMQEIRVVKSLSKSLWSTMTFSFLVLKIHDTNWGRVPYNIAVKYGGHWDQ